MAGIAGYSQQQFSGDCWLFYLNFGPSHTYYIIVLYKGETIIATNRHSMNKQNKAI